MFSPFVLIRHTSEDGSKIIDLEDASKRTEIYEAVAPYRQLYVIQIIRFWVELLIRLQDKAMAFNNGDIPFFDEIFSYFYNEDSFIRKRKTWDKP